MCSRWHRFHTLSVPFLAPISTTHLLKAALYLYQCVPISHRQVSIKCAAYFPAVAVKTETGAQMSSFPSRKNSKLVPPAPPPLQYTEGGSTLLLYKLNGVDVWEARVCKLAAHRSDISPRGRNSTPVQSAKSHKSEKCIHSRQTEGLLYYFCAHWSSIVLVDWRECPSTCTQSIRPNQCEPGYSCQK